MPSIRKNILQLVFSGSYMTRWNDKLRPMELYEVDKQAHKMLVAWMLYMRSARAMAPEERWELGRSIVEGGLFEYFFRLVITDIKPPVFYEIKANPEHYRRLSEWVLKELDHRLQTVGPEFMARMGAYLAQPEPVDQAGRILAAAHMYASRYEFHLIKGMNPTDEDLDDIESDFTRMLEEFSDVPGLVEITDPATPLGRLAGLCGRLRFQRRWAHTPRVPETSVLGHMFVVGAFAYLFSLELGACTARRVNNFFSGLVHDLPELLTRDIISPVKRSVEGLGELILEYEERALERKVFGPLDKGGENELSARLRYLMHHQADTDLSCTVSIDGTVKEVAFEELQARYNTDVHDPRDGRLIKLCDDLAAFIEAYSALRNGIEHDALQQAIWRMRATYQRKSYQNGLHIGALLADFD